MWLMYRDVWRVLATYPENRDSAVVDCGLYALTSRLGFNFSRIGVSSRGLVIKTAIVPKSAYIIATVPWHDVWARERGAHVWLSFTNVEDTEFRVNRVLVTTMQRRLRSEVPLGHVI